MANDPLAIYRNPGSARTTAPVRLPRESARTTTAKARKPKPLPKQPKKPSWGDYGSSLASVVTQAPAGAVDLVKMIPGAADAAVDYFRTSTPGGVWDDTKRTAGAAWDYVKENPGETAFDAAPLLGDIKMLGDMVKEGAQARADGDPEMARLMERYTLPLAAMGVLPDLGAAKLFKRPVRESAEELARAAGRPVYDVAEEGPFLNVRRRDVEPQIIPEARGANLDQLRGILANPETNPAARSANEYTLEELGQRYRPNIEAPGTSLQKQGGIARIYQLAAEEDPAYKHAIFERYGEQYPGIVEGTRAQNYDQLTEAAYNALGDKTIKQFDRIPLSMRYHFGEGEYPAPSAMLQDVLGQGNLNVFRGGDPHPYLGKVDPVTGLSLNEMFRAAHDFYGHGPQGSTFRPGGEELAYANHASMMDPLERMALLSETRGQNSWVNYGPANADLLLEMNRLRSRADELKLGDRMRGKPGHSAEAIADVNRQLRELGGDTRFAPQSPLLLPPEFLDPATRGGIPEYLRDLIVPRSGTGDMRAVHLSTTPGLTRTDPAFYGTGHRGDDWNIRGAKGSPSEHTSFYLGERGTVIPEPEVAAVAPHAYETRLNNLYDINDDPDRLVQLARAYNVDKRRRGNTLAHVPDLTRLVEEYGYTGYTDPNFMGQGRGAANVFRPVEDLKPIERGPQGYAEGGVVEVNLPGYAEGGVVEINLPGVR